MNTSDLISIILPVYNRQDVIGECIHSVLAQSYQHFEIIIVDDGSSDQTCELCKRFAASEPRIKLFAAEHGGVSAARNRALHEAGGEYVFFLDSDDVIHPFLLESLLTGMKENRAPIGATDVVNVRQSVWSNVMPKLCESQGVGEVSALSTDEVIASAFGSGSALGCIGGVMMRRDLIGSTAFRTDLHIGEDFYFIYENIIKGACAVFLKEKWYFVRNHEHNSSWDYSFRGFLTRFYRRKLVWENEEALGRDHYARNQKRSAFACFLKCVRRNKPYSTDAKKMRDVLKDHHNSIYPALTAKEKLQYQLFLHLPATAALLFRLKKKLSRFLKKKK